MDNQGKRKDQVDKSHLFIGICLIALGLSILGNLIVEWLSK